MKVVNLNRASANTEVSVTSPYKPNVIPLPTRTAPVQPTLHAEQLRSKLQTAPSVETVRPYKHTNPPREDAVKPSRAKRFVLGLGAAAIALAGPSLLSIAGLGLFGFAVAGGLALVGIALVNIGKRMK